ncbi:MAG TPA: tripartite tricarboxylate transporter substrate binding protein [Ramlibacter sp.]|nr:tripartite tricarboxylate transporter substrate binding protein [Ramlibacter sp.]
MNKRSFVKALGLGLTLAYPGAAVLAQGTSSRPIRMLVPLPAGTSNDFATRTISTPLAQALGQPIIVENKPGGNGAIATLDVVRAAPDGLTLLCGSLSPLATNMAFVKNLPYDPRKDLTPIGGATITNHVLVVKANSPIKSLADFIAYAKQRPGKVSIGYSTSVVQLQIASLNKLAGIELLAVPYKGSPASITDVIGGVLDATLTDHGNAMAQAKGGNLHPLAVSSLKRNAASPDWPAISETLRGFDFPSWNAFMGPAGMPREQAQRISAAVAQILKRPDVVEQLGRHGTQPLVMNPDETKAYIAAEVDKYVRLAREANIQPE